MTTAPSVSEHSLGSLTQVPEGEGRLFECTARVMAVFHLRNAAGTTLVCPLHARKFDLDTGGPIGGDCAITSYRARVTEEGELIVVVDTHEGRPPRRIAPDRETVLPPER